MHLPLGISQELPPWFLERQNITRRPPGKAKGLRLDLAPSASAFTPLPSRGGRRPAEFGRSACRALLGFRGFCRGKALLAGGQVGLQGRTDASKTLGSRPSLKGWSDPCSLPVVHVFHLFYLNRLASSPCACQAADCTLVTTSSRLPKKVKDWLAMSAHQHRPISKERLRRLVIDLTAALDCLLHLVAQFHFMFTVLGV